MCNRNFGTTSIEIHLPQCRKKQEAAAAQSEGGSTGRKKQEVASAQKPSQGARTSPKRAKIAPSQKKACVEPKQCPLERMDLEWQKHLLKGLGQQYDQGNSRLGRPARQRSGSPARQRNSRLGSPGRQRAQPVGPTVKQFNLASAAMKHSMGGSAEESHDLKYDGSWPDRTSMAEEHNSESLHESIEGQRDMCKSQPESLTPMGRALAKFRLNQSTSSSQTKSLEQGTCDETSGQPPMSSKSEMSPVGSRFLQSSSESPADWSDEVLEWNEEDLVPCPHCHRTFLPDRLEVHLRSCQMESPGRASVKSVASTTFASKAHCRSLPNLQRNAWQECT